VHGGDHRSEIAHAANPSAHEFRAESFVDVERCVSRRSVNRNLLHVDLARDFLWNRDANQCRGDNNGSAKADGRKQVHRAQRPDPPVPC